MTQRSAPLNPTRAVAERVKELRRKRDLSGAQLAQRMTDNGIAWDRSIVANLENGRRASVSVAELLTLAYVLEVAPVHLLVPLDDAMPYQVTPALVAPAEEVRQWVRGFTTLAGTDVRLYGSEVPEEEFVRTWTRQVGKDIKEARRLLAEHPDAVILVEIPTEQARRPIRPLPRESNDER